ncbi:NADPH oxidase 1 isoform X2 [Octodon degus]|uniref:NADPH oxidase 1 isoform X2 n=1 Tax=Octodon degus TaxID=10160 RepID=A0A6P3FQU4_OCTDE|nr:NADPH oxidase 1 isoform X2 [Octodon degus]
MRNWLANHWFSALWLLVWMALNAFLFAQTFLTYEKSDNYYYTREILGFCNRTLRKPLDHNLTFHKLVAYMICIFTAIHIIAHLFNFERYSRSQQATDGSLTSVLSSLSRHEKHKDSWLNPILSPNTTVLYVTFTSIAGLTGVIGTLALILMVTSAMEFIRRNYFELFWVTHQLFVVYMVCLAIHGIGGIVRGQTKDSMDESHPHNCAQYYEKWGDDDSDCKYPQFEGKAPESWKWILAPVILYAFEKALRFLRSQQSIVINKVIMHPSRVLELQMTKPGFRMEVGQYIFVKCPSISHLEWHPFTLTSAPEEDFFSIHVRVAGDWTENLVRAFEQQHSLVPRIAVDGPFGTVSEDVFQYEVAMLVGTGIGVTPFASILKSIWYKFQHEDHNLKTQTIYFYWICRETGAFAWFNDLLISLEREMEELGKVGFLNYRLFLTGWDGNVAGHAALNFDKATDILTGLKEKTYFGRPKWENEFSTIATAHPKSVVGVFLCGPRTLAKNLRECCHRYSSLDPRKVQFYFNQENF